MGLSYTRTRKSKPRNDAQARELAAEWEQLLAAHSKPLERGAKAKGVDTRKLKVKVRSVSPDTVGPRQAQHADLQIRSVQMSGAATKAVPTKDMQEAIHKVSSRVGMSYNKGGLQYLTDDELREQRTGAHKRRT